jgi:ADP-heptose:LPS heptosyltransferase
MSDARPDAAGGRRILVIKHGALGDFVLATGPFQAIRAAHLGDHITLLTTAPYAAFARASGYFDDVWVDDRPGLFAPGKLLALRRRLVAGDFARVYDLQTSDRSSFYFHLFPRRRRPEWSGIARGCSHPHANPDRDRMHTVARQAEQLEVAGIAFTPPPDLGWVRADVRRFGAGANYALFVPGGSPHRPAKRWPVEAFAKLARLLAADGIRPVLIGGAAEDAITGAIAAHCPEALDLAGMTALDDIVGLARQARAAVGNDTGPMHLIAASGCPSLVLFSAASDPALCAPRGPRVEVLRRARLAELEVDAVSAALGRLLRSP